MKSLLSFDVLGFFSSSFCVVHCLILPVFVASSSLFEINSVDSLAIETTLIFLSISAALSSFPKSYRSHRNIVPVSFFFLGFIVFVIFEFYQTSFSSILASFGSIFIALAHIYNYMLLKKKRSDLDSCDYKKSTS